ncbi:hypothetical protein G9P44_005789 [Scheffersomyces stipitis]|nr:hypothetical protein G9P44_005789 [Scheffersomyces stipitis]
MSSDYPPVFDNPASSSSYLGSQFFNFEGSYNQADLMGLPQNSTSGENVAVAAVSAVQSSPVDENSSTININTINNINANGNANASSTGNAANNANNTIDPLFDYSASFAGLGNNNTIASGNSNISPITVIPESLHINDEIFFNNNYQFTNGAVGSGTGSTAQYDTHNDDMASNMSSTNSLNNYFQRSNQMSAPGYSPQLLQSKAAGGSNQKLHQQFQQQQQHLLQQQQHQIQHQILSTQSYPLLNSNYTTSNNNNINNVSSSNNHINSNSNTTNTNSTNSNSNTTNTAGKPSSSSSSFSSSSSNSMVPSAAATTPTISETSVFTATTPSIHAANAAQFSAQVVTPQYTINRQLRHNSTSVPVDQLTSLSLKSLSTPTSATGLGLGLQSLPQNQQLQQQPQSARKSPSPDYYYTSNVSPVIDETPEERTINPRQLFTSSSKIPTSMSSPTLSTLFSSYTNNNNGNSSISNNNSNNSNNNTSNNAVSMNGISATLSSQKVPPQNRLFSSNIPNLANSATSNVANSNGTPLATNRSDLQLDFKMNDECYNAITYWLNNTLSSTARDDLSNVDMNNLDDVAAKIMVNPTGIIKGNIQNFSKNRSHSYSATSNNGMYRRRNSVQSPTVLESFPQSSSSDIQMQKLQQSQQITQQMIDTYSAGQKKKRRKSSVSYDSTINVNVGTMNSVNNTVLRSSPTQGSPNISPTTSNVLFAPGSSVKLESVPDLEPRRARKSSPAKENSDSPTAAAGTSPEKSKAVAAGVPMTPNNNGAFSCTECDKQFKRSEHLKRHIRSVHSNIRPFHCKYCEKKFSRSDNLAQHLKTHYRVDSEGNTNIIYGNPNNHSRTNSSGAPAVVANQGKKK